MKEHSLQLLVPSYGKSLPNVTIIALSLYMLASVGKMGGTTVVASWGSSTCGSCGRFAGSRFRVVDSSRVLGLRCSSNKLLGILFCCFNGLSES